jgi:hypothetical protein
MSEDDARLSRLLFEAREVVDMYADVVRQNLSEDAWLVRLRGEIDAYRAERGWSPNGFGDEAVSSQE